MKKKSYGIIAGFLAFMLCAFATVGAFANSSVPQVSVDGIETEQTNAENSSDTDAISANKSDYYTRIADMNEDWMLNSADARQVLRKALKLDWIKDPSWLPKGSVFGDIDANGTVNSTDARWTLRVALKLNTVQYAIDNAKPYTPPSVPSSNTSTKPSAPTESKPTEPTTNENAVTKPLCEAFSLKVKTNTGVEYTVATNGLSVYIKSADVLKGISVLIQQNGQVYLVNEDDAEYTPVADKVLKRYKASAKDIQKFVASLYIPVYEEFDGYKVTSEIFDDIPYTAAEKNGVKFFFYADGSVDTLKGKTYGGKDAVFTVENFDDSPESYINILEDCKKVNSSIFLIKNDLPLALI